jgi:hypothetical protein
MLLLKCTAAATCRHVRLLVSGAAMRFGTTIWTITTTICTHAFARNALFKSIHTLHMWMSMANLPSNQVEVQKRIVDLEARLKTRGQRPEPDIPELDSVPSPIATQAVLSLFTATTPHATGHSRN